MPVALPLASVSSHRDCVVCGRSHPFGLRLAFTTLKSGHVQSWFCCDSQWNGYAGMVHGGVTAAIVDGAMTHALFSAGIVAVTAALSIRYHDSLSTEHEMSVEAWVVQSRGRLHRLEAVIEQDGSRCVSARAQFMERRTQRPHLSIHQRKEAS